MKRTSLRLTTALLTFGVGLTCAGSFRPLNFNHAVIVLAQEPAPRNNPHLESLLRAELLKIRRSIDLYAAGEAKGLRPFEYPRSLEDLVRAGYLRELPVDPMTGERDWQTEELVCVYGRSWGVMNVRSRSTAISSEDSPYSEW